MLNHWSNKVGAGFVGLAALALSVSACNSASPISNGSQPLNPVTTNAAAGAAPTQPTATAPTRSYATAVLLYEGDGVAASDAQSLESILSSNNISYNSATSAQLNAMTADQFNTYGMLLVPGGEAETMSSSLNANTISLIQNAVTQGGMGYMGICAAPLAGSYGSWGLGLAPNNFDYYVAESQGVDEEAVEVSFPDGSKKDLIWYGGPQLNGYGNIVGKYPDGTAAIAQSPAGSGFVLLSGVHPEAPDSWRSGINDTDSTAADFTYVVALVQAALKHSPLPAF